MAKLKTHEQFMEDFKLKNKHYNDIEIIGRYKSTDVPIECRCKIHDYKWFSDPSNLLKGSGCKYCWIDNSKLKIDFIKEEFMRLKGYELLEKEYINSKTPMKYRCPYHPDEELYISWGSFNNGSGCKFCANNVKYEIEFIREEFMRLKGYILLEETYINSRTPMRYQCPHHPDKELRINYDNLKYGQGCYYCGIEFRSSKQRLDFEFIKKEFESRNYELLETVYINGNTPMKYKCFIHPEFDLYICYNNFRKGCGCPICSGRKVAIGINDMWTTNPEQASWLLDPEDGYKYMQCSNQKVNWKCPDCENIIKNKQINTINRYGLACRRCLDGISYPNKLMYQILKELNIQFETEQKFKWCKFQLNNKNKTGKYDFVFELNNIKYIIEMDGGFQNNILNSELNNLFDLNKINWELCHKNSLKSKVIEACKLWNNKIKSTVEIGKILNVNRHTALDYLKRGAKIGLCDYDSKLNKSAIIKCACITTNQIFNSISEATKYYNMSTGAYISSCCKGKSQYSGIHPETKEKLIWEYYDENKHKDFKLVS